MYDHFRLYCFNSDSLALIVAHLGVENIKVHEFKITVLIAKIARNFGLQTPDCCWPIPNYLCPFGCKFKNVYLFVQQKFGCN